MSVIVFCVFLCISGCFHGSSADEQNITKKPGDDVTLMCEDPEYEKNSSLLEWRRKDSKYLFVFRDGKQSQKDQHESFRNRVFLKDSQVKDGDLSVVLKNVTINDTGTYQCRVKHDTSEATLKMISSIHLFVDPPGDPSPGQQGGLIAGIIIGIVLAVLAAVVLWIYKKKLSDKKMDEL